MSYSLGNLVFLNDEEHNISWPILFKITERVNFQFFDQNHGLTPLEKFPIWPVCKINISLV